MNGPSIAAVVLAAGESRRLGRPKQLVLWDGTPLVRRAVSAARASRCARVVVVTGAVEDDVRAALAGLDLTFVSNPGWREGIASSIRAGVAEVRRAECEAAICVVCDQPALDAAHLDRLIDRYCTGAPIVASRYAGRLGVPALFARSAFEALLALRGDAGARRVIGGSPDASCVDWPAGAFDVDTPIDLARDPAAVTPRESGFR